MKLFRLIALRLRLVLLLTYARIRRSLGPRERLIAGRGFYRLTAVHEQLCAVRTDAALVTRGKAQRCYTELGTVLSLLDRLGSCWWGCRGGEHIPEYLLARAVLDLRSAIRLFRCGYYDEAMSLARNAGEVANLFALFEQNRAAFDDWRALDGKKRWQNYRPAKVREALKDAGALLITDDRYSKLGALATHAVPETRPQAHNPFGAPNQVPNFQLPGMLVTLNEVALVAAVITIPATALIDTGPGRRQQVLRAGVSSQSS